MLRTVYTCGNTAHFRFCNIFFNIRAYRSHPVAYFGGRLSMPEPRAVFFELLITKFFSAHFLFKKNQYKLGIAFENGCTRKSTIAIET